MAASVISGAAAAPAGAAPASDPVPLPAGAGPALVYNLRHWQRGNYSWQTPSSAQTRWRFRSEGGGADATLSLLFPDSDMVVDGNDWAPRVRGCPIGLSVEAVPGYTAGRITSAEAWVSHDQGATRTGVPVHFVAGHPVALADNTKAAALTDLCGVH